jgi:hypothetical protein
MAKDTNHLVVICGSGNYLKILFLVAASGQRPKANGQRPTANGQQPAANGQLLKANGQRPTA